MNDNWTLKKDGYYKTGSTTRGNGLFEKPAPPVRDGEYGFPLKPDSGGKVDWQKLHDEKNAKATP